MVEQPGTMIGRYKLLQQIGEGGFGVVFRAWVKPLSRSTICLTPAGSVTVASRHASCAFNTPEPSTTS